MLEGLRICPPAKEDIEPAFGVFEEAIRDAFERDGLEYLQEDIQSEIEQKKHLIVNSVDNPCSPVHFLVAKIDERVIGTVSYGPCGRVIQECTEHQLDSIGELGSLYVLPDEQGKGVASALIASMIHHLSESGVEQFCLDSGYRFAQTKWLRKFGEPYITVPNYWGEDRDHMIWLCSVSDIV